MYAKMVTSSLMTDRLALQPLQLTLLRALTVARSQIPLGALPETNSVEARVPIIFISK